MHTRNVLILATTTLFALGTSAHAEEGTKALAAGVLKRIDLNRGLCAVVGRDRDLAIELAKASELLVHLRDPNPANVVELRTLADKAGLDLPRFVAEHGSLGRLPYADNTVDVVLCTEATPDLLKTLPLKEVLRALRPGGLALFGNPNLSENESGVIFGAWSAAADAKSIVTSSDLHRAWIQITKPALEGADEWTHWEKSPDNNPVSNDIHIKAPYMTQFMAEPYYIGMPAITTVAGGRTFLAMGHIAHHEREWDMLNRLVARNGYNGTILWERKLPEDYLVHRSAFVASEDTFHMIDGDHCLLLDARTGKEKGEIRLPNVKGAWKWMAIADGVLYVLTGEAGPGAELVKGDRTLGGWSWADLSKGYYGKFPHGYGDTLVAYHLADKKVLWTHREDSLIDSRGLAIRDNRFYLYCPDKHLRALDLASGDALWTNARKETLGLIEEAGKGLISTPGWRTQSLIVATPKALVLQGQTRMNVIGISSGDGKLLWQKKKVTNNPNALYLDGNVIVGVGPQGKHIALDPVSGDSVEYLGFTKRACTRLTASTDSLFVRGEGMLRFDRKSKRVMIDGAVRPGCNDGVIPANGLLYLGPWACDCNLSLIGNVARCSAGDFVFDRQATSKERLETFAARLAAKPVATTVNDWATYRGNVQRSASTPVRIRGGHRERWRTQPPRPFVPSVATAAGGMIFYGGDDGKVRALDASDGKPRWSFQAAGVVKYPPTIAEGRAYVGSGDGWVYCLDASNGNLLWRFRASPVERHVMIYGTLSSTWPVNTGILVHEGRAYFAAGIVDHDGTYLYALDAKSGEIIWQNNSSGHLNEDLRKGVSAQGNLTIMGDRLLLAGGNVVSPASFDLKSGKSLDRARAQGQPQSNGGKFVGVFHEEFAIAGGRILYASPRNVSTKGSFSVWSPGKRSQTLNYGGIPPAWNKDTLATANFKYGPVIALDAANLLVRFKKGLQNPDAPRNRFANNIVNSMTTRSEDRWRTNLGDLSKFETVSLAVTPNAVVAVAKFQDLRRAKPLWTLLVLASQNGRPMAQQPLQGDPLPGGLLIDRNGRVIVTMLDGSLVCYAAPPK